MKIVKNKWLPFKGFGLMTVFWWIFTREDPAAITHAELNHEHIHIYQMYGVWLLTVPLLGLLCATGVLSPWWLLALPGAYYELYFLFWLLELLLPPYDSAYADNCFERAACRDAATVPAGWRHAFSWLGAIRWKR